MTELVMTARPSSRLFFMFLIIPFAILNPVLLLMHGYYWDSSGGTSSAALVYAMKLTPLIYLTGGAWFVRNTNAAALKRVSATPLLSIMAATILLGMLATFAFGPRGSIFYILADLAGATVPFLYVLVTLLILDRSPGLLYVFYRTMIAGCAITSIIIIAIFSWSDGNKVSIPPDIHYGISLTILLCLTESRVKRHWPSLVWATIILIAVGVSQFRMNLLVAIVAIVASLVWSFTLREPRHLGRRAADVFLLLVVLGLAMLPMWYTLDRLSSMIWNPLSAANTVEGNIEGRRPAPGSGTVEQRYLEAYLVVKELQSEPISVLIGQGFGATFENLGGVLQGHDSRVHTVHNSLFALLLRNGIFGVILFVIPALLAIKSMFTKSRDLFIASAALLAIYFACMTDQYVYWGGYFGIALGIWMHLRRAAKPQVPAPAA